MSKILTMCTGCTAKMRVPDKYLGQEVACPKCEGTFLVKDVEAKAGPTTKVPRTATKQPPAQPAPQPASKPGARLTPPTPPRQVAPPAKKSAPTVSPPLRKPAPAKAKVDDYDQLFEEDHGDLECSSTISRGNPPKRQSPSNAATHYDDDYGDYDEDVRSTKPRGLPPKIKKKKSKAVPLYDDDDEPEGQYRYRSEPSGVNGGLIWKGVFMVVGAIVWFVVGLQAGWIYYYPPVLLVLGLATIYRGLDGSDE